MANLDKLNINREKLSEKLREIQQKINEVDNEICLQEQLEHESNVRSLVGQYRKTFEYSPEGELESEDYYYIYKIEDAHIYVISVSKLYDDLSVNHYKITFEDCDYILRYEKTSARAFKRKYNEFMSGLDDVFNSKRSVLVEKK